MSTDRRVSSSMPSDPNYESIKSRTRSRPKGKRLTRALIHPFKLSFRGGSRSAGVKALRESCSIFGKGNCSTIKDTQYISAIKLTRYCATTASTKMTPSPNFTKLPCGSSSISNRSSVNSKSCVFNISSSSAAGRMVVNNVMRVGFEAILDSRPSKGDVEGYDRIH